MTDEVLNDEEESKRWGWGLQDDYFYRKCFQILDREHDAQVEKDSVKPMFITMFNVSNHMDFIEVPLKEKYLSIGPCPATSSTSGVRSGTTAQVVTTSTTVLTSWPRCTPK